MAEATLLPRPTVVKIMCCLCGIPIESNPSNTCAACLASTTDVTKGISTEATLHQCRGCQRWHRDAGKWIGCELESRELMALCLANVAGLKQRDANRVRLVDAMWIWTEPHSMRLKIKLTVQREVQHGTILQQSFVVTFVVRNQQCIECQSEFRQGTWKSLVQVRQRVAHKRTFLYLEQLILKHSAHRGCLSIEAFKDGMDFYFPDKSKAARFISFLENVVPIKLKTSKKLIGTDDKNNIVNYKFTNYVEICPLCKDDLVYLPKKLATSMGNIARCVLVKHISNLIHFVDPLTGQTASIAADIYWRQPFRPIVVAARSRLTRYVVLGKDAIVLDRNVSKRKASSKQASRLAMLTLAKESDLGLNDAQIIQTCHVGYLMKAGDVSVGYDLKDLQLVDEEAEAAREAGLLPDAIVCRKLYGGAALEDNSNPKRIWKLQRLDVDVAEAVMSRSARKDVEANDMDEEDFMRQVEADKDMRTNIQLYKSEQGGKVAQDELDDDNEDDQQIKLDELLDGLALNEGPDNSEMKEGWDPEELLAEGERAQKDGINYVGREDARNVRDKDAAVPVGSAFGMDFVAKSNFNFK